MKMLWKAVFVSGAFALASSAFAEEAAAPAADAAAAPAASTVELTATGDHVVNVNTGNATVDAAANLAAKCAERSAAFHTCEAMGGFKAMGCRKLAEIRYKEVQCPL